MQRTNPMYKTSIGLFYSVCLLLFNTLASGKETIVDSAADSFKVKIDRLIKKKSPRLFNGVIVVAKNNQIIYSKSQGYRDFERKIPISTDDRFRIMSNSKQIASVLAMKQEEAGKLDLHIPISQYLPHLKQDWAKSVTTHQLMNMSSGIVDVTKPTVFEPGNGYRYSNPSYGLLGEIIEHVSGVSFSDAANTLFDELGMKDTQAHSHFLNEPNLAPSYWIDNGELVAVSYEQNPFTEESWNAFLPAGGIVSSAQDLLTWDTLLHGGKILSRRAYNQLMTASNQGPHSAFGGDMLGYGYGIRIHSEHQILHFGHGGRGFGFVSFKFHVPDSDITVVIWENVYSRHGSSGGSDTVYYFENAIREIIVDSVLTDKHKDL